MLLFQKFHQAGKKGFRCFYHQQGFPGFIRLTLPPEKRSKVVNDIDAGGQAVLNQSKRQLAGYLRGRDGG